MDLPAGIPTDPNPRERNIDKMIYREVKQSLLDENDPTFHLKNKGITLLARTVRYSEDKRLATVVFDDGHGMVDGAHTYEIIMTSKEECPKFQYVKIEVLTGVDRDLVSQIAKGLNTAVQVQQMSLSNLEGKFQWIKDCLKGKPYEREIAYKENEEGAFSIRDIIAFLTLFNIDIFPDAERHPKEAYVSKAKALELYLNEMDGYKKLRPILNDILQLHDYIHKYAADRYNKETGGKARKLAFYQTRKRGKYRLVFLGEESKARLYDGALYPILAAFRVLVERDRESGEFRWKLGSFAEVKTFVDRVVPRMIQKTKNTSDNLGKNPNAIGKDDNHWTLLYQEAELALYR